MTIYHLHRKSHRILTFITSLEFLSRDVKASEIQTPSLMIHNFGGVLEVIGLVVGLLCSCWNDFMHHSCPSLHEVISLVWRDASTWSLWFFVSDGGLAKEEGEKGQHERICSTGLVFCPCIPAPSGWWCFLPQFLHITWARWTHLCECKAKKAKQKEAVAVLYSWDIQTWPTKHWTSWSGLMFFAQGFGLHDLTELPYNLNYFEILWE